MAVQTLNQLRPHAFETDEQQRFQKALALHQHGKRAEAEAIYQQILIYDPTHFDAVHLLGLVKSQNKSLNEAETLFRRAILLKPEFPAAYFNLAQVLKNLNRPVEAIENFEMAIDLNPAYVDAYLGLGKVLIDTAQFGEAVKRLGEVSGFSPENAHAIFYRGIAHQHLQQFDLALAAYDSVIEIKPQHAHAHMNRATILKKMGRLEDALTGYEIAHKIMPANAEIFYNRGLLLYEMRRLSDAREAFDGAVSLDASQEKYFFGRAKTHYDLEAYQAALDDYTSVLGLNENHLEALLNIGAAHQRLNNYDAAIKEYKKAIDLDPLYCEALYNAALAELSIGDFSSGWDHYEWRLEEAFFQKASLADGLEQLMHFSIRNLRTDLEGKTLFIAAEQGVGDHIMFLSMLPDLVRDARKVICQTDRRLIGIFSRCFPEVTFVGTLDVNTLEGISVDRFVRMGSLGYTYRRDARAFPGTPYLKPDAARVAQWRTRLPLDPAKKIIGVSWRGGTDKTDRKDRSILLEHMRPLLDHYDCTFVSLQYGDVEDEIAEYNAKGHTKLLWFPKAEIDDFEDFAGLIGALDCVVSVQNTTVHTCGALGKPCFTLLPTRAQWRYGASGNSMPWYRSVKLFRQRELRKWDGVLQDVNSDISEFLSKARHEQ